MKNKAKPILLILSLSCVTSLVGYSAYSVGYRYSYSQSNKIQAGPAAYIVGKEDVKYTSIEKALDVAQSGDIVCVIPPELANYNDQTNKVNPDRVTYKISRNCEIKEGVTLFIPTDKSSEQSVTSASTLSAYIESQKKPTRDQGSSGYNAYAEKNSTRFLRISIEIEEGVTLTNKGTLLISGYLGGGTSNSGCVGQTSHSYSQIVMGKNSQIVQNSTNATTYCFGFILEATLDNGSVFDLQSGNLYIPTVLNDSRGFTFSYAMTNGAIDTERCSAFNEMEFRNIQVLSKIHYSSSVYGIINIYVQYDTLSVDETMTIEKGVVGTTNSFLIHQTNSTFSLVEYKYNPNTSSFKARCYGGFTFHYLSINLSLKGQSLTLSTQNAYFPLSYKFDVELLCASGQSSATFDITNQRMKIMTGSKVSVGENVTLNGNEIVVYSALFDGGIGGGQGAGSPARPTYGRYENGIFTVASTASVSLNKLGGLVYCDNASAISATTQEIVSKEPWTVGTSGSVTVPWTIDNFLLLTERLTIVATDRKNKKKICASVNVFSETSAYVPQYRLLLNNGAEAVSVGGTQQVIFRDEIENFSIDPVSNVFSLYSGAAKYTLGSIVTYNETSRLVGATNTSLSVSSNNGGINEFLVQSISITGETNTLDLDTVTQLTGTIVDIEKAYDKKYTWKSLNTLVATVDQTGLVKGVGIGTTTIELTCGGVTGSYAITVIEPLVAVDPIAGVVINESGGNASGSTFIDDTYTFTATLTGESGNALTLDDVAKVEWSFENISAVPGERVYFGNDSNNKLTTESGVLTVKVTLAAGANANTGLGASADEVKVVCTVTDKKGNVKSGKYHIVNDNNSCLVEGTLIRLANGKNKKVEDLCLGDLVLVFNHETGKIDVAPIIFITHEQEDAQPTDVISLSFDNGVVLRIAKDHALFDKTLNQYVVINSKNAESYLGHAFAILEQDSILETSLVEIRSQTETVRVFCPVSAFHMNLFADGILTMPTFPYDIQGLYNIFALDESMRYDERKKAEDTEKYGLFSFEEFHGIMPISKEAFLVSPAVYLKVSLGKGLITKEQIVLGIEYLLDNKLIDAKKD